MGSWRAIFHMRRRPKKKPAILMYHRIADPEWDPWALSVSAGCFSDQLEFLRATRTVMTMDELADAHGRGRIPADAVAITFDDGYRDNLTTAKPLLQKHQVPATFFLATAAIGSGSPFWWDELADMVLGARAGSSQSVCSECTFGEREAADNKAWRAAMGASTQRQSAYLDTWWRLRDMAVPARDVEMARLREVFGAVSRLPDSLPMDREEITALVADNLASIGAHSVTHPALGRLTPSDQCSEIADSVRMCRELVGHEVRGFAYPYGDISVTAIESVRRCGLGWACSTEPKAVTSQSLYDLPRVQVLEWDAENIAAVLSAL
jgi:peptidoglycan/xylan/chitin deacetylase (PgdA/CDA1 family)